MKANKRDRLHIALFLFSCFVVGALAMPMRQAARNLYEDAAYAMEPSAARAFEFGSYHLDTGGPNAYNLDRAEYFFTEALERDPDYPYAYHQLARVSFLRGDFSSALGRITIEIERGNGGPNSYYVRGLIEGYMDNFDAAARDYEVYLESDPSNWAAINDYAWVLVKAGRADEARVALEKGLVLWPENPWLLNSAGTAYAETNQLDRAAEALRKAQLAAAGLMPDDWLLAYPGNDPLIAREGVLALQKSIDENIHTVARLTTRAPNLVR